ncbi:hypothetical protein SCAR479_10102 [Seiridium cardinale]|uniref:Uncharacterized protein n=1 Tax=Seiridium cardinale TaxID=138064 RepID=A0ABR2XHN8_9PEZI
MKAQMTFGRFELGRTSATAIQRTYSHTTSMVEQSAAVHIMLQATSAARQHASGTEIALPAERSSTPVACKDSYDDNLSAMESNTWCQLKASIRMLRASQGSFVGIYGGHREYRSRVAACRVGDCSAI